MRRLAYRSAIQDGMMPVIYLTVDRRIQMCRSDATGKRSVLTSTLYWNESEMRFFYKLWQPSGHGSHPGRHEKSASP